MTIQEFRTYLKNLCQPPSTQERVAVSHGVSPQYFSEIIRGVKEPSEHFLNQFGFTYKPREIIRIQEGEDHATD